jgi:hypothetical protein
MRSNIRVLMFMVMAAMTAMASSAPRAEDRPIVPHAKRVPLDAAAVVAIPDAGALWNKLDALPLAGVVRNWLNGADMQANLDYQQFQLERAKLEAKLGYPATPGVLFGQVLADATFYMRAPTGLSAAMPPSGLMATAKDTAKARKLVEAIDALCREEQAASSVTLAFEKIALNGATASHYVVRPAASSGASGAGKSEGYYAMAGQVVAWANNKTDLALCLGLAAPAGGDLSANADLRRLAKRLPWDQAHATGWINGDAVVKSLSVAAIALGTGGLSKDAKAALALSVEPKAARVASASSENPATGSTTIKPGKLSGLGMISASPIIATDTREFDPQVLLDEFAAAAANPMLGALTGRVGGLSPLAQAEKTLGVSLRDDVAAALGSEMTMSMNDLSINPAMPMGSSADVIFSCRLRDPAKMRATMKKIEASVVQAQQASPQAGILQLAQALTSAQGGAGQGGADQGFTGIDHNGTEVRSFPLPLLALFGNFSFSYAISNDDIVIGLSSDAVINALDRKAGAKPSLAKPSLAKQAPAKQALAKQATSYRALFDATQDKALYDFMLVDFNRFREAIIQPLATQLSDPQGSRSLVPAWLTQGLATLDYVGAVQYWEKDALMGQAILVMH